MKNVFTCLLLLPLLVSCEPKDPYRYDASDAIELKKDPCFGFCPVYEFRIDGKGYAVFTGDRNVDKEGRWERRLTPEETNQLFQAFDESNFWAFEDEYVAEVTDLPTTWITLRLGEQQKTIKDYYGAPEPLKDLEKMVETIAEAEEGWERSRNEDQQ